MCYSYQQLIVQEYFSGMYFGHQFHIKVKLFHFSENEYFGPVLHNSCYPIITKIEIQAIFKSLLFVKITNEVL